jgi:hypothetical protein
MSVAVIPMAKELGWTATERGLVSAAFFWGYSLTQIPAGWVSVPDILGNLGKFHGTQGNSHGWLWRLGALAMPCE